MKSGIKWTILLSTVADRWDPQNSRPHTSVTRNRAAALRKLVWPRLVDGELHRRWHLHGMTPTTSWTYWPTWSSLSSELRTVVALMVARRGEMTVVCQWRPWWLNLELRRASLNYREPSTQASIARGGLWRRGHNDGVSGGAPAS